MLDQVQRAIDDWRAANASDARLTLCDVRAEARGTGVAWVGEVLIVGDRLDTDILGANRVGSRTAMVLTGVSTRQEIVTTGIEQTIVVADLPELLDKLKYHRPRELSDER